MCRFLLKYLPSGTTVNEIKPKENIKKEKKNCLTKRILGKFKTNSC